MGRLKRPLDPEATAAADEQLYARHEKDPRPNALFDAVGNRKPLDSSDPDQAGVRQEWRDLYSAALQEKSSPAQPQDRGKSTAKQEPEPESPGKKQPVGATVQECPLKQHWMQADLVELEDIEPRPDWWWPKEPGGFPYPYEPYSADITDGHKESALNSGGTTRYDCIPEGTCRIQFKQFLRSVTAALQVKGSGGSGGSGGGSGPPTCPEKATFKEFGNQRYGWDSKTAGGPWKSVEKAESDKARVEIKLGAGTVSLTEFISTDTSKVTVAPANAAAVKEIVTVTGVDKGVAEVRAVCQGGKLGKMKVKVYGKKTRTVAVRLVHGLGWPAKSTDVSDAAIRRALRKVYKQAVVEFTLSRLAEMTVDFDLNKDGMIDVNSWMSAEMVVVRDNCKDDSYDFNLFLVDNPTDGSTGFMDFNQRYGFIHAGLSNNAGQTMAHELGHGQGLPHEDHDAVNVMDPSAEAKAGEFKKYRLRKPQWDKLNP